VGCLVSEIVLEIKALTRRFGAFTAVDAVTPIMNTPTLYSRVRPPVRWRRRLHESTSNTHFSGSDTVADVVIGMADGLTVPFALARAFPAR